MMIYLGHLNGKGQLNVLTFELLFRFCQNSAGRIYGSVFLASPFCSIDLCTYLCKYHVVLITVSK